MPAPKCSIGWRVGRCLFQYKSSPPSRSRLQHRNAGQDLPENANSGRTKRSRFFGFALLRTASARFRLLSTSPTCGANCLPVSRKECPRRKKWTNLKTCNPHPRFPEDQLSRSIDARLRMPGGRGGDNTERLVTIAKGRAQMGTGLRGGGRQI
jgi:hypothetical protein